MLDLIGQFTALPFFETVAFGISAMVLVGGSWCLVGYIMGDAPKRGIEPCQVHFFSYLVALTVSIIIIWATRSFPRCSAKVTILTCGALAAGGSLVVFQQLLMSYAMQRGPNGIIWAIIQSALIFPFLGGILFFGVQPTWYRLCGLGLLLAALVFFALAKDTTAQGGGWKFPTFLCLALTAVQQNLVTAPAYYEGARAVNSIVRTGATMGGGFITVIFYLFCTMTPERRAALAAGIRRPVLWKYVGCYQLFNLIFAYTLFYPGMNVMADHGLGGMCFPMMVGSCIITFTLFSVLLLKERIRPVQAIGLGLCAFGLSLLCLPAK